jgi:hypothetical protein
MVLHSSYKYFFAITSHFANEEKASDISEESGKMAELTKALSCASSSAMALTPLEEARLASITLELSESLLKEHTEEVSLQSCIERKGAVIKGGCSTTGFVVGGDASVVLPWPSRCR